MISTKRIASIAFAGCMFLAANSVFAATATNGTGTIHWAGTFTASFGQGSPVVDNATMNIHITQNANKAYQVNVDASDSGDSSPVSITQGQVVPVGNGYMVTFSVVNTDSGSNKALKDLSEVENYKVVYQPDSQSISSMMLTVSTMPSAMDLLHGGTYYHTDPSFGKVSVVISNTSAMFSQAN